MRIRKPRDMSAPINLDAERDRLAEEFHGVHWQAIQTVEDDEILSEMLAHYIDDGMPVIDLATTPKHRRPQVIEETISEARAAQAGGPCDFCGTRTQRSSGASLGWLDSAPSTGFTLRSDGTRSCAWCTNFLASHTIDEWRESVGNAVAGTMGIPVIGLYRYAALVPIAKEAHFAGTAFGFLTEHWVKAIREQAGRVVHPKRWCVTESQARQVSLPGLQAPVWDPEWLAALSPKRVFRPLADAVRAAEEEQALAERRKQHEKNGVNHRSRVNAKVEQNAAIIDGTEADKNLRKRARELGVI